MLICCQPAPAPPLRVCAQGKLRILYECFPMAMLVEQAGGVATSGTQRILDIVPDTIHGRWACVCACGCGWGAGVRRRQGRQRRQSW